MGKAGQGAQVNVGLVEAVAPGHVAGQHARVGGIDQIGDQRELHAGNGGHAPPPQH